MKHKGFLITFEGGEGSGKTIQKSLLINRMEADGHKVIGTREPGGTLTSDAIREILLDNRFNEKILPKTEVFLFLASRAQNTGEIIIPALIRGEIVLCDRYRDSMLAYQAYGQKFLTPRQADYLNDYATDELKPDLAFLLDVEPRIGLERRRQQGGVNRLDILGLPTHKRIRASYLKMVKEEPERFFVVDTNILDLDEVHQVVYTEVIRRLKERGIKPQG
ncbi:dTMP kinase [Patescibacteria group bacterium]